MTLYVGLVHYPVYNKNQESIASAITNVDLHDISRLARTYDVGIFFVITPLEDQQKLAKRIVGHWVVGYGATYNPHRKEAIALVKIVPTIEETIERITGIEGQKPLLMATTASKQGERPISYSCARMIINSGRSVFLIFGTAWGLAKSLIHQADYVLDPIEGCNEYNHLSVRSAAAIILDRLVGRDS